MDLQLTYHTRPDGTRYVTIPDATRTAVISFIRDNATTSVADIEALVEEGHRDVIEAVARLSQQQAQHKPSTNDWSILELMAHIVSTKRIIVGLCQNLGEGHWPPGVGAEWEEERAQDGVTVARFETLGEARAAADAAHNDLLALVRKLDSANPQARFKHFLFGAMNAREWAVFQRVHDADHAPQLRMIQAAPNFPAD